MNSVTLRVLAVVLIVAAGVVFFADQNTKVFVALLVLGNVLSIAAHFVERRTEA